MKEYIQKTSYPICPYCGSTETAELIYGYFSNQQPIWKMIRQGRRVFFGGCQMPSDPDQWSCMNCGKQFRDEDTEHKTTETAGHDYYVRVIIKIRDNKYSSIKYDLNMLSKELGVWINGTEHNKCQGYYLNDEQYNVLKKVLRQMKYDYENTFGDQIFMDFDRNVKSHYSAAMISDDGYPLVTRGGSSCDSRLIKILASFTLSYTERIGIF